MTISRDALCRAILRKTGKTRRERADAGTFTKDELLHLSSYLDTVKERMTVLEAKMGTKAS